MKFFSICEYRGDYQIDGQKYWGCKFDTFAIALSVACSVWREGIYVIVFPSDSDQEEISAVVYGSDPNQIVIGDEAEKMAEDLSEK